MDNQPPRPPQQPVQPTPPLQTWQSQPTPIVPPLPITPPQEIEPTTSTPERPDVFIPPFYQPPVPKKSRKKRWLIIVAAVLAILIGGAAAAYFLWYQNPEKVVTDGIVHAMQAKSVQYTGSLTTDGASKVKIELTGASAANAHDVSAKVTIPIDGKDFVVEGEGLFDGKNDLYLKLKNLDDMTTPLRNEINSSARATFDRIIAKINNQWVKISVGDLAGLSVSASKAQSCVGDTMKQLSSDQATMAEITDAYKKNKFVIVDQNLGTKDGSLGYTLTGDAAKTKAFIASLKNTKLYKSLQACDSSFTLDENDFTSAENQSGASHAEVWVNQFTHEITKVVFTATSDSTEEKATTVFEPTFNTGVTVATPSGATTLEQLQADIETLFNELAQPTTKTPIAPKA